MKRQYIIKETKVMRDRSHLRPVPTSYGGGSGGGEKEEIDWGRVFHWIWYRLICPFIGLYIGFVYGPDIVHWVDSLFQ